MIQELREGASAWLRLSKLQWNVLALALGQGYTGSAIRKWVARERPKCVDYPGGPDAFFQALIWIPQPQEARVLLESLARGEPPKQVRPKEKGPDAPGGIAEPLQASNSPTNESDPADPEELRLACLDLLGEAKSLCDRASEYLEWPASKRLASLIASKTGTETWGSGCRTVIDPTDLDDLIVPVDPDLTDTPLSLRHLAKCMPEVVSIFREHLWPEARSFFDWLLARSRGALWEAREAVKVGVTWAEDISGWLKRKDEVIGKILEAIPELDRSPSSAPYLWNARCRLRQLGEFLNETAVPVAARVSLYEQLIADLRPHFDSWAIESQRLPIDVAFSLETSGLVKDDPRGVIVLLSTSEEIEDWGESVVYSYNDPGCECSREDLEESYFEYS